MWLFVFIPNLIWVMCIFYVLYQDKIKDDRKILYLLLFHLFFAFADTFFGSEYLNEEAIEIVSMVIDFMFIGLVVYWINKRKLVLWLSDRDILKTDSQTKNGLYIGIIGFLFCIVLIMGLFILIGL